MEKKDLLQIRNFGEKSASELYNRLREMNLLPAELDPDIVPSSEAEDEVGHSGDATEVAADDHPPEREADAVEGT